MSPLVVALLPFLWLPGHFAFRLSDPLDEARRDGSPAEVLFGEVAISTAVLLWVGVTLATLGSFTPAALLGVNVFVTVLLAFEVQRRGTSLLRKPTFRVDGVLVAVVVLIVAGALLYRPSFEQIVGGRDPVTYLVSGIYTAREGSWVVEDQPVTTLDTELERTTFLGTVRAGRFGHWGPRFIGWYLMDPDSGRVVPQGLPLYPSAVAYGYLAGGIEAAVRVTTVLAIASVVALFFLGRRLMGAAVGFIAAVWLLASPTQVWFSRFANAETIAQLLVVAGLYGLVMHRRYGSSAHGVLAGLAFGLSWQAHIWMVWLVLPLLGIFIADLVRGRVDGKAVLSFWAPLFVLGCQALLVYFTITTAYLWGVYAVLRWSLPALVPAAAGGAVILAAMWYWGNRRSRRVPAATESPAPLGWIRPLVAASVALAAVYGYALRPRMSNSWAAEAVPRLTLTTGIALFALAVLGALLLLIDRRRSDATICLVAVTLGISVPVLWHPAIQRPLMWSLRRFQSFLPLVYLLAAVALWWWVVALERRAVVARWASVAAFLIAGLLLVPQMQQSWEYRGFKQPGHAIALVDDIAASMEPDAVLLFEARSGWGVLDFAAPLAYWKGFEVYRLHAKEPSPQALLDFVRRQAQRRRPVYFFTQGFTYFFSTPRAVPHRRWWYPQRTLEETIGYMPRRVIDSRFPFAVYRLEPAGSNGPLDGGIDVGGWDDLFVGEALPTEIVGPLTARWTRERSYFWLPGMPAAVRQIVVHADTVADSESLGRTLRARLDGVDLGEIPITAGWPDYIFDVPSDWQPREGQVPRLELSTTAVQPDSVAGNGDTRKLGVLVNAILWQ